MRQASILTAAYKYDPYLGVILDFPDLSASVKIVVEYKAITLIPVNSWKTIYPKLTYVAFLYSGFNKASLSVSSVVSSCLLFFISSTY